jgi:hypothetical protein
VIANQVEKSRLRLNSEYTSRVERWFERGTEVARMLCKSCAQWMKGEFGSRRAIRYWLMTLGAVSLFLLLPNCQQGYSAPVTLCDEWCAAHDRTRCAHEDPAECVVVCERQRSADVENGGPPGMCDGSRRAVIDCVDVLPDSVFDCAEFWLARLGRTCQHERTVLSICEAKQSATWPAVCNRWATQCSSQSPEDGGVSWDRLYESCLPISGARGCSEDEQVMVDCLAAHDLTCDVLPLENAVCEREKLALDSCNPLTRSLCAQWSEACSILDVDADAGPPDSRPHSFASCLAASPIDKGGRCRREFDALYRCFEDTRRNRGLQCDVVPLVAPECQREREVFTACAPPTDGGAY